LTMTIQKNSSKIKINNIKDNIHTIALRINKLQCKMGILLVNLQTFIQKIYLNFNQLVLSIASKT
jgi:hypothetical protein